MNLLIIGNIIAFIAASLSIIMGITKSREKLLYVQTVQFFTYIVSNFILGGISGAIAGIIGAIRNILCYKNKLTKNIAFIIILSSTLLILTFNNLGFIGLLPLINTIIYTIFINEKNPLKFKTLYLTTVILWLIYDITIKAYTSAAFDIFSIIASIIAIYQMYNKTKKETATN